MIGVQFSVPSIVKSFSQRIPFTNTNHSTQILLLPQMLLSFIDSSDGKNPNKFYIILIVLLSSKMRDQRYYQRLKQIRQKYGYSNQTNPEQTERKQTPRNDLPQYPLYNINNQYGNNYDLSPKANYNKTNLNYQQQQKKTKENSYAPVGNNRNGVALAGRQVQPDRILKENYIPPSFKETRTFHPSELSRPMSSNSNPSSYPPPTFKQQSSPIRKLQMDFTNQITPRQSFQLDCRTQVAANPPTRTKKPIQPIYTQRKNPSKIQQNRSGTPSARVQPSSPYDRSLTPKNSHQPFEKHTSQPRHSQPQQFTCKFNYSINNIDKIQQKIQAALNKSKK